MIWKAPQNGWNSNCVWAPEIHFIDGHWYVYYAAGKSGPPFIYQRAGVLRSKTSDVFSDYEDMGMLYTGDHPADPSTNIWAIDMTVFKHRGKLFAVWSGWLKQLEKDTTPGWIRDIRMQPFLWNSDGTPNFGKAIPAGVEIQRPSGEIEIEKN